MDQYKHKLLDAPKVAHTAMKDRFNTSSSDPNNANRKMRSDALPQTAATGLFLVLLNEKWQEFPNTMKVLWILCILAGSGIQWSSTWLLFLFLHGEEPDVDIVGTPSGIQLYSSMMSCVILAVYVFGEIRQSFMTLWHCWAHLEFGLLYYWVMLMLLTDISLEIVIAVVSTLAIQDETNISDQLGISLAFFFILELNEWVYKAFIEDFDVLEEDDFSLKSVDPLKSKNIKEFYEKRARIGIAVGIMLLMFCVWVVAYFYLR